MLGHSEFPGDKTELCASYQQNWIKELRKSSFYNLTNYLLPEEKDFQLVQAEANRALLFV